MLDVLDLVGGDVIDEDVREVTLDLEDGRGGLFALCVAFALIGVYDNLHSEGLLGMWVVCRERVAGLALGAMGEGSRLGGRAEYCRNTLRTAASYSIMGANMRATSEQPKLGLFPQLGEQKELELAIDAAMEPERGRVNVYVGDAITVLRTLPDESVQSCVTSPPYWGLRDYGIDRQLQVGAEESLADYLAHLVSVFSEVARVLRSDGTLWLNLGDSYTSGNRGWRAPDRKNPARSMDYRPPTPAGLKPKDLIGVPWRVAFALQAAGWFLRSDIIWHKPNAQPESVRDRPTQAHEYLFLLSKSEKYRYHDAAVMENSADGKGLRKRRSVWSVPTQPFPEAHFATFPEALVEPCILAATERGDSILDPFLGAGTVGVVAARLGRDCIGIELNPSYAELALRRALSAGSLATMTDMTDGGS